MTPMWHFLASREVITDEVFDVQASPAMTAGKNSTVKNYQPPILLPEALGNKFPDIFFYGKNFPTKRKKLRLLP